MNTNTTRSPLSEPWVEHPPTTDTSGNNDDAPDPLDLLERLADRSYCPQTRPRRWECLCDDREPTSAVVASYSRLLDVVEEWMGPDWEFFVCHDFPDHVLRKYRGLCASKVTLRTTMVFVPPNTSASTLCHEVAHAIDMRINRFQMRTREQGEYFADCFGSILEQFVDPFPEETRSRAPRRVPFAPLVAALGGLCDEGLAVTLAVSKRTVQRYHSQGVPIDRADEVAVAAGLHPALVWDDW